MDEQNSVIQTNIINLKRWIIFGIIFFVGLTVGVFLTRTQLLKPLSVEPLPSPISINKHTPKPSISQKYSIINIDIPSDDFYWNIDNNGNLFFGLNGKLYTYNNPTENPGDLFKGPIVNNLFSNNWKLIHKLDTNKKDYELFNILRINNNGPRATLDFLYILRHDFIYFDMYRVSLYTGDNKLIKTFIWDDDKNIEGYNIPKINKENSDGTILIDMYGCWNCGAHKPTQMIYYPTTGEFKRQ